MFNGLILDGQVIQDGDTTILFVVQKHCDQDAASVQCEELKKLLREHCEANGQPYGYREEINGEVVEYGDTF
jgi:hypothetical protein